MMRINSKIKSERDKKTNDFTKTGNTKASTKESTLIESFLNNINQSNNRQSYRKEYKIKTERAGSNIPIRNISKKILINNDNFKKPMSDINNVVSNKIQNDVIQSHESLSKEEFKFYDKGLNIKKNYSANINSNEGIKCNLSKRTNEVSSKELTSKINMLEAEKKQLEHEIIYFKKIIRNHKKQDLQKTFLNLQKEKDIQVKKANNFLNLCSQLAEEVIILRNQVDKFSHLNNHINLNINSK